MDKATKVVIATTLGLTITGAILQAMQENERQKRRRKSRYYYTTRMPNYYKQLMEASFDNIQEMRQYATDRTFNDIIKDF